MNAVSEQRASDVTTKIRIDERAIASAVVEALREGQEPLETRIRDLEAQLAELRAAPKPPAGSQTVVRREPLTYDAQIVPDPRSRHGLRAVAIGEDHSYFADQIAVWQRGDRLAQARLERHGREMAIEQKRQALDLPDGAAFEPSPEARAPSGSFAAPPLWLVKYFATAPRPGRVLAAEAANFDLPPGCSTVNVPRLTTGGATAMQGSYANPIPARDVTDAAASSNVTAIAGTLDVPLQMLEQSPVGAHFDWVAFTDLEADYNFQLETALLNGNGQGTNLLGLLNNLPTTYARNPVISNPTPSTIGSGSSAATTMFTFLGAMIAAVGRNRLMPPALWLAPTPRVAWLGASEDNQNRPLMITDKSDSGKFNLLAFEVLMDDAIQPIYASAANPGGGEERIILCRPEDWMVLEGTATTQAMQNPISGSLEVRLSYRRMAAAINRYPSGSAVMVGVSMQPSALY